LRCLGFIKSSDPVINLSIIFVNLEEKLRIKYLSCNQHNSIKLKTEKDGDKLIIIAPTASIIGAIEAILSAGRLFITTLHPEFRY
jgi:hypothetical protein